MATRTLEVRIIGDAASLSREFARVGAQAGFLERRLGIAGAAASRVGTQLGVLSRNAALVGAVGFGAAIKTAVDYEAAFAEVEKTVDATDKRLLVISDDLRNLSKEIPESAAELANLAGEAGALGVAARDITDFTKVAAQLGTTTNLASEEAATSLARFANIMDSDARGAFERTGSTLVDLGNKGASTEAEITEMALRIAGAGKTIGLAEPEVLGLAAALANVGIRAEAGGSSISRVLLQMSDAIATGSEELRGFARIAGVSTDEFIRRFREDAPGAIALFAEGLGKVAKEGGSVSDALKAVGLNEIRVRDTLLRLAGNTEQFSKAQQVANRAWRENTALSAEAEKRYETLQAQVEMLRNHAQDLAIELGEDVLPVLKDVTSILREDDLPLGERIERITDILIDEAAELLPEAAGLGGKIMVAMGEGFAHAWEEANPLQKVLIGASAIRLLGGRGALMATGATIGRWIATGTAQGAAVGGVPGTVLAPTTVGRGRGVPRRPSPWSRGPSTVPTEFGEVPNFGRRTVPRGVIAVGGRLVGLGAGLAGINALISGLGDPGNQGFAGRVQNALSGGTFGLLPSVDESQAETAREVAEQIKAAGHDMDALGMLTRDWIPYLEEAGRLTEEQADALRRAVEQSGLEARVERDAELIRDSYDRAFKLDDLVQQHKSNLATIRANFGRNTRETRQLTAASKRAIARHIDALVQDGRISMREARRWLRRFGLGVDDLPPKFSDLETSARQHFAGVGDAAKGMERDTKPIFADVGRHARKLFAGIEDSADKADRKARRKTRDMAEGVSANVLGMTGLVTGELQALNRDLNKALDAMGVGTVEWSVENKRRSGGFKPRFSRQTGGPIFRVPGAGTGDIVDAMVPPGWFVLNRRASAGLQDGGPVPVRLEPGETLWPPEMAGMAAALNDAIPRFQQGGLTPGISQLANTLARRFGLVISSGLRPGDPGHHGQGLAADLAGPAAAMDRASAYINSSGIWRRLLEGIYSGSPALSVQSGQRVPPSFWGSGTWAGHADHLHLALSGSAGPLAREIARRVLTGPDGPLRDLGQAVLDRAHRAANRYLRRATPMVGPESGGGLSKGQIASIWRRANPKLGNPNLMAAIALAESSGIPTAVGHDPGGTQGLGLWQITTGFNSDLIAKYGGRRGMFNPASNAKAAGEVLRRQGLGAWVAYNTGAYRQHLQRGGLVGAIRKARESGGALPPINVTVNTRTVVHDGAVNSRRIETIAESVVVGHARSNRQHARMGA